MCVCVCGFVSLAYKRGEKKGETAKKRVWLRVSVAIFLFFFLFYNSCGLVRKINTLREKKERKEMRLKHML